MADDDNYLDGWLHRRILRQVEATLPKLVDVELKRRAAADGEMIADGVCVCRACGTVLALGHVSGAPRKRTTVADVIQLVAAEYGVDARVIVGNMRTREASTPRQTVMWLAGRLGISSSQIGRVLHRDHTTVLGGKRRVEDLLKRGGNEAARVRYLETLALGSATADAADD